MEADASPKNVIVKPPLPGRLLRREEFLANKANGKRWVSKTMIVSVSPNNEGKVRVGLTVSKTCGNAVVRNRIRRRLRHLAKENCAHLTSVDVVIIGKQAAETADWDTLKADIAWCLKRIITAT